MAKMPPHQPEHFGQIWAYGEKFLDSINCIWKMNSFTIQNHWNQNFGFPDPGPPPMALRVVLRIPTLNVISEKCLQNASTQQQIDLESRFSVKMWELIRQKKLQRGFLIFWVFGVFWLYLLEKMAKNSKNCNFRPFFTGKWPLNGKFSKNQKFPL